MNSKQTIIRKVYPYFHAAVLVLAIIGIVNCFVVFPNVYEIVMELLKEIDPLVLFRGGNGQEPSNLSNLN